MQPVATAHGPYADIVRLDVSMGDTCVFPVIDHAKQVVTKALQQVDMQPSLFAEPLPKRLLPGTTHQDTHAVANREHVAVFDDMWMPALLQDFTLVFQPLVVVGIAGNLEHILLALTLDKEGHRAGTLAEASHNSKIAWKEITLLRPRRVFNKFVLRRGQLLFNFI